VGKLALALMTVGIHLYVLPMFLAGLEGQPVDIYEFFEGTGVETLNLVASIGAFVLVLGILVALGNAAFSWNHGLPAAGHDPWAGATLEWFALSPPPPHNFDAVPDVRSAEPLHDIREAIRRRTESWRPPARVLAPEPSPPSGEAGSEPSAVAAEGASDASEEGPESRNPGPGAPVA
jgi:heme/copper-type cytochrome/quinol oxidase subunit 1